MRVAVVGAGKMGVPLACQFARRGAHVVACDVNAEIIETINRAICPIDEPGLPELLSEMVRAGRLSASTNTRAAVAESDVVVVIVPVLLTADYREDTSIIDAVSREIASALKPGALVSYETTLPVGGARRLAGILEESGLKAGEDFDVVFSPERVKSQFVLQRLTENIKVVGGITPKAAERGASFYAEYLGAPVENVNSLEAAELVKLAGMVYRDVNIALSNELARYAERVGVDFGVVLRAANTDGEAALLEPGIGVGGHCTPVYPHFLISDSEERGIGAKLAKLARSINDQQPSLILDRLERVWEPLKGHCVLILGLGFRPQVKEHTCSPAFQLREELHRRGAQVCLNDPLYSEKEIRLHGFVPGSLRETPVPSVIILNTAHETYRSTDFAALAAHGLKAVVDGRNLWAAERVQQVGLVYLGIGRPQKEPESGSARYSIPIARPLLGIEESIAISETIRSGWIAQGAQVSALEREFAAAVGAKHACAVSNCTAALHLALLATGLGPGNEVITVTHSFIATANSIRYCGATPVFVDIDPATYNINPSKIQEAITERTRAILCVHQMGMPCDLAAILEIGQRHGLPVIEDAACATGSEIFWKSEWERIGKPHGEIACFSFHPRKIITTGDGGMLTTSNPEFDRQFRLWRQHGMSVSDATRHGSKEVIFESFPVLGFNYRMTDMQAAVGREQLRRLPSIIKRRRWLADRYREMLAGISGLEVPQEPQWARTNWQSYCVRLPQECDQRQVMQRLLDQGISTRRGVMCAHREPPYRGSASQGLTESEKAQDHTIILPLFHQMTHEDQERIALALRAAVAAPQKLRPTHVSG
jgi:nucleotide sugar dehydrogenase